MPQMNTNKFRCACIVANLEGLYQIPLGTNFFTCSRV